MKFKVGQLVYLKELGLNGIQYIGIIINIEPPETYLFPYYVKWFNWEGMFDNICGFARDELRKV